MTRQWRRRTSFLCSSCHNTTELFNVYGSDGATRVRWRSLVIGWWQFVA